MEGKRAVVMLSGGLDSATVAALAKHAGFAVYALSFDYGQRHRTELAAASRVAAHLGVAEHRVVRLDLRAIGGSALTDDAVSVPKDALDAGGIPVTYVPARNTIFLALALGYAETIGASDLFFGANALDYSGYPDCRPAFVEAFERLANVATKAADEGRPFHVHAPLMQMTKAQIIREGVALGVDYALTHSCYDPSADGIACGHCDSCLLRKRGFEEAGVPDPTRYA
jgi:7-cyano-7-deazaguanine synthase